MAITTLPHVHTPALFDHKNDCWTTATSAGHTHTITTGDLTTANTPDWARGTTTVTPTPPYEWDAELNAYPHEHDFVQRNQDPHFCLICKRTRVELVKQELKRKGTDYASGNDVIIRFNSDGSFVAR